MVKIKMMNETAFAKLHKEFNAMGELIRARQEEKQAILDEFSAESRRFFFGAISERALMSSIRKTNKELQRLDAEIRRAIQGTKSFASNAVSLATAQKPISYRATLSGIRGGGIKATKKAVKKTSKKATKKKTAKKRR